jgi:hypothetical protein
LGEEAHVLLLREGDEVRSPWRDRGWTGGIEGIVVRILVKELDIKDLWRVEERIEFGVLLS